MALNKGKHIVKEIDNVLCTVVESGISIDRKNFLKGLLEFNKFEVKTEKDEAKVKTEAKVEAKGEVEVKAEAKIAPQAETYSIGVTDLVFNPMIAVYENSLKKPTGEIVSPSYWNQQTETPDLPYFDYRKRNPEAVNEDEFLPVTHNYRTV
jgi:hypothetical protein